jgi:hypothetical protein
MISGPYKGNTLQRCKQTYQRNISRGDTSNGAELFIREARANNTSQKTAKTSVGRK